MPETRRRILVVRVPVFRAQTAETRDEAPCIAPGKSPMDPEGKSCHLGF